MATETPVSTAPVETTVLHTTRRGIATSAFCLGLWASLTFWWYPFGMWVGLVALLLGTIANWRGWRAETQGDNLAFIGQCLGGLAVASSYTSYRLVQYFFEDYTRVWP
jgi:hypothetical protein